MSDARGFLSEPDSEFPGWHTWQLADPTRFNALVFPRLLVRRDDDGKARLRFVPGRQHTNLSGAVHGGAVLSLVDIALFACSRMLGVIEVGTAVTLDMSVQFIGPGREGEPCDAVTELLRETRRLVFLRGTVEQPGGHLVAAFSGTIRKPSST
ncbi:PaaI family thioesterase [Parablastomonas sp. CN1-191]|uniref:PaaI family thioesterase n=1 Tax=Parablastomonas sp. CN1-191 TaxID=3400908 RepID=UPI003BF82F49